MLAARSLGTVMAIAAIVAGCGLVPGAVPAPGFRGDAGCASIPMGACREQLDRAAARHPDATLIEVTCTIPICDRKGGAGTMDITLSNGARVTETFVYTGDPNPLPLPACIGLPLEVCRSVATDTVDELVPSKAIRAISIKCTASSCTQERGEADVEVQYADGTRFETSAGWAAAAQ